MLAYVIRGADAGADSEVRRQADAYALRLAQLDSNKVVPADGYCRARAISSCAF